MSPVVNSMAAEEPQWPTSEVQLPRGQTTGGFASPYHWLALDNRLYFWNEDGDGSDANPTSHYVDLTHDVTCVVTVGGKENVIVGTTGTIAWFQVQNGFMEHMATVKTSSVAAIWTLELDEVYAEFVDGTVNKLDVDDGYGKGGKRSEPSIKVLGVGLQQGMWNVVRYYRASKAIARCLDKEGRLLYVLHQDGSVSARHLGKAGPSAAFSCYQHTAGRDGPRAAAIGAHNGTVYLLLDDTSRVVLKIKQPYSIGGTFKLYKFGVRPALPRGEGIAHTLTAPEFYCGQGLAAIRDETTGNVVLLVEAVPLYSGLYRPYELVHNTSVSEDIVALSECPHPRSAPSDVEGAAVVAKSKRNASHDDRRIVLLGKRGIVASFTVYSSIHMMRNVCRGIPSPQALKHVSDNLPDPLLGEAIAQCLLLDPTVMAGNRAGNERLQSLCTPKPGIERHAALSPLVSALVNITFEYLESAASPPISLVLQSGSDVNSTQGQTRDFERAAEFCGRLLAVIATTLKKNGWLDSPHCRKRYPWKDWQCKSPSIELDGIPAVPVVVAEGVPTSSLDELIALQAFYLEEFQAIVSRLKLLCEVMVIAVKCDVLPQRSVPHKSLWELASEYEAQYEAEVGRIVRVMAHNPHDMSIVSQLRTLRALPAASLTELAVYDLLRSDRSRDALTLALDNAISLLEFGAFVDIANALQAMIPEQQPKVRLALTVVKQLSGHHSHYGHRAVQHKSAKRASCLQVVDDYLQEKITNEHVSRDSIADICRTMWENLDAGDEASFTHFFEFLADNDAVPPETSAEWIASASGPAAAKAIGQFMTSKCNRRFIAAVWLLVNQQQSRSTAAALLHSIATAQDVATALPLRRLCIAKASGILPREATEEVTFQLDIQSKLLAVVKANLEMVSVGADEYQVLEEHAKELESMTYDVYKLFHLATQYRQLGGASVELAILEREPEPEDVMVINSVEAAILFHENKDFDPVQATVDVVKRFPRIFSRPFSLPYVVSLLECNFQEWDPSRAASILHQEAGVSFLALFEAYRSLMDEQRNIVFNDYKADEPRLLCTLASIVASLTDTESPDVYRGPYSYVDTRIKRLLSSTKMGQHLSPEDGILLHKAQSALGTAEQANNNFASAMTQRSFSYF